MNGNDRLDQQSGLFPQKMLETLLIHEIVRSRRYPSPVSLIHFSISFPEPSSEQIVESARLFIANLLHSKLREADLPGHYEGDYLVILPATDGAGARTAAQRILKELGGSLVTRTAEHFKISACIGVSSHAGGAGISASHLLSEAAAALGEARRRGPNSLVLFDEIRAKRAPNGCGESGSQV
ncbi:MAG: diguanylate cyclase [Anaerolineales bacterium]|nr:diguanylate cyclase [Anaerolineales bacterium]